MEHTELEGILRKARLALQRTDRHLLKYHLHERTVTARLAMHLQERLPKGSVFGSEHGRFFQQLIKTERATVSTLEEALPSEPSKRFPQKTGRRSSMSYVRLLDLPKAPFA